jgi:acetyltransferase-like isoleucine patch superfamily enzyme
MQRFIKRVSFITKSFFHRISVAVRRVSIGKKFKYFGADSVIYKPEQLTNANHISIGNGVMIRSGARLDALLGKDGSQYSPHIHIGNHSQIENRIHISCVESVVINDSALIASNVFITDHGHEYKNLELPIKDQGLTIAEPVEIGRGNWIGQNCVILPGTVLGKHCVVGSNSVVKGTFPDFSVIAGAPAKILKRYNFSKKSWERVNE